MSLLFDVVADQPKVIALVPVFPADKQEALKAGKELFPGLHRHGSRLWVTHLLEGSLDGTPGTLMQSGNAEGRGSIL